jgi:tRNA-specific 2-thiouridylase
VDAGHEVVGVHLALSRHRTTLRAGSRGCCTIEDSLDARRVADSLGIPFYVWDFSERFRDTVVQDFMDEYAAGRTPNPCMRCNEHIKFAALLEKALSLGFDAVATGHYADVRVDADGNRELHRAADWAKDQSYVLGVLTPEQLAHALFPLGATPSKAAVRAEAAERGFLLAQKPDSHDICFIPDGDTRGWLAERLGTAAGDVVDRDGTRLGSHDGAHAFTVGQRKGLDLRIPSADGRPRFVLEVRTATNEVVVGPKEALEVVELAGERFSWVGVAPESDEFECEVQIRAHADPVPATARISTSLDHPRGTLDHRGPLDQREGAELVIRPHAALGGVAPGQTAVLYIGTRVVGQCTIDRTVAADLATV